ncbi:MAG: class I SAM-dependent methyltransferase [Bacteroidales bacterium]|jgi:23S rRNA (cytosine1962-C5)-methyltransferase|nr:class I SAM-dependent methyltransferase [Bacteroidales bacterium]
MSNTVNLFSPQWEDYELMDTGGFEKLERFGKYLLVRPEPQAIWPKSLPPEEWGKAAAVFRRENGSPGDGERGEWKLGAGMAQQWQINYRYGNMQLRFRLGLTTFKHVGIFPEQAVNWNYIYDTVCRCSEACPQTLNLFAYTGGASLAARAAGAEVVHVDAVRQVINWGRENMEASRLSGIRWVVEDALKYVGREVRRGRRYHGIILDPPAYGRGPAGEKWILEEGINELMAQCRQLLVPQQSFIVLNLYSMGFSPRVAENLVEAYFPAIKGECGELSVCDRAGRRLPLGVFMRGTL